MVFKNKLKLFSFFCLYFLIIFNSEANIIYDKNNIIITEIDLGYYKKLHFEKYNEIINNSKAIKNLVIIKKLVNNLKINNDKFLEKIDKEILNELDVINVKSDVIFDIIRYFKTRNEFIFNYMKNDFQRDDLENIFKTINNFNLPISSNNCLTIIKLYNFKDNSEFVDIFYESIKTQSAQIKISIENQDYYVCINEKNRKIIDKEIFRYVDFKIEDKFNEFIYAQ